MTLIIGIVVIAAMMLFGYAMGWVPFGRGILRAVVICYATGFAIVVSLGLQGEADPRHGQYGVALAGIGAFMTPMVTGFLLRGKSAVSKVLYIVGLGIHIVSLVVATATGMYLTNMQAVGQETINRMQINHTILSPIVFVASLIAICFELFRSPRLAAQPPQLESASETNNPYQPPGAC